MAILNEDIEIIPFEEYEESTKKSKEFVVREEIVAVDWYGTEISIRKTLPLTEAESFYKNAVDVCFTDDGYSPQLLEFIIGALTISSYTNLEVPSDQDELYDLVFNTDIVNTIKGNIYLPQYLQIIDAITEKVKYTASVNIKAVEAMFSQLGDTFESLNNKFSVLGDMVDKALNSKPTPKLSLAEEEDDNK